MKKVILCFLASVFVLSGCSLSNETYDKEEKLSIVTTIQPLYAHTLSIVGELATVHNLLPLGQDVHTWQPTPQSIAMMEDADMLIINGAGLEEFLESYLDDLQQKGVVVVDSSVGISQLEDADFGKGSLHIELEHADEEHEHTIDPHVWLDPDNAIQQSETIAQAIVSLDPDNQDIYMENLARYISSITDIDQRIEETFAQLDTTQQFLVFHDAYNYYLKHFGLSHLKAAFIEEFEGDSLSPKELIDIVGTMKDRSLRVIITEPGFSPKIITTLEEELGYSLLLAQFSPLGLELSADGYVKNLQHISDVLYNTLMLASQS